MLNNSVFIFMNLRIYSNPALSSLESEYLSNVVPNSCLFYSHIIKSVIPLEIWDRNLSLILTQAWFEKYFFLHKTKTHL